MADLLLVSAILMVSLLVWHYPVKSIGIAILAVVAFQLMSLPLNKSGYTGTEDLHIDKDVQRGHGTVTIEALGGLDQ